MYFGFGDKAFHGTWFGGLGGLVVELSIIYAFIDQNAGASSQYCCSVSGLPITPIWPRPGPNVRGEPADAGRKSSLPPRVG